MLRGAGGWTRLPPTGGRGTDETAHVRHVVTDHHCVRQGVGRTLVGHIIAEARAAGVTRLDCLSTRTAVPFYQAMGFVPLGPRDIMLRPGIVFPAVEMRRNLT